jgi:NDP-sugar pyrophosphorylase family protein
MILAAGLGTRLRPLTNDRPKALVTVGNRTLLEIAIERLRGAGVQEMIVNVHHHAEMVVAYLQAHGNFGLRIEISREHELLDTGGGLKKAAPFFLDDEDGGPFLVHNVDVISTIDLARMVRFHSEHDALATMATQRRATSRPLLFDQTGQLRGRGRATPEENEAGSVLGQPQAQVQPRAFSGIHVISPRIFPLMKEEGAFSIIDVYLRLAAIGERIVAFDASQYAWRDLGRPEHLTEATREMAQGTYG